MAMLIVSERRRRHTLALPHRLFINGQMVGIMQGGEVCLQMPQGRATVVIQSMLPWLSASMVVEVREGYDCRVVFADRERLWDILFGIDLVVWVVRLFLSLTPTANLVYHLCSDGFFVVWAVRTWLLRRRYFHIEASSTPAEATIRWNATQASR